LPPLPESFKTDLPAQTPSQEVPILHSCTLLQLSGRFAVTEGVGDALSHRL
jgi:hypothetical protein